MLIYAIKYAELVRLPLGKHQTELESDYRIKTGAIEDAFQKEQSRYMQALNQTNNDAEKKIIENGLSKLNQYLALKLYQEAMSYYNAATNNSKITIDKYFKIIKSDELINAKKLLNQALKLTSSESPEKSNIEKALFELALSYKQAGNIFYSHRKLLEAKRCYLEALELFNQCPNSEEIIRVLSNLSQVSTKEGNYEAALQYIDQVIKSIDAVEIADKNAFLIKVNYNKCNALLNKLEKEINKSNYDINNAQERLGEVMILYDKISAEIADKNTLVPLNKKLVDLKDKIQKGNLDKNQKLSS